TARHDKLASLPSFIEPMSCSCSPRVQRQSRKQRNRVEGILDREEELPLIFGHGPGQYCANV
ncbi:hypothetical protein SB724_21255, partial [Bacillus sp. SIMBA_031]|uniref:hypothetical protein n=1 Tax=Bacillus sp. SIMBA_031 TaxID=3085774 RepID=UPI00397E3F77